MTAIHMPIAQAESSLTHVSAKQRVFGGSFLRKAMPFSNPPASVVDPSLRGSKRRLIRIKTIPPRAKCRIGGETFFVEVERRRVYLKHPHWSLMGVGRTLLEAERALRDEAGMVVRVYGRKSPTALDYDALRLYHFALNIA